MFNRTADLCWRYTMRVDAFVSVKRVLDNPDDPMVAEQAHQELLQHLVKNVRIQ